VGTVFTWSRHSSFRSEIFSLLDLRFFKPTFLLGSQDKANAQTESLKRLQAYYCFDAVESILHIYRYQQHDQVYEYAQ
jgi:hypothetical protein